MPTLDLVVMGWPTSGGGGKIWGGELYGEEWWEEK